ncbi:T9SS type A sorting domain-containing protein [Hymenobacter sp. 15J16-1T3B]|nr:T9SS type A sorting domain-containing protein [Hymenobacter sp. 15J16-1T3B]
MLRRLAVLLVSLLASLLAPAQTPAWQPVSFPVQLANSSSKIAVTATDAAGNVYVAGGFYGTLRFGSTTLVNADPQYRDDIFVAKWTPTGGYVWAQQASGASSELVSTITAYGGSVYVSGTFLSPTLTIGSTVLPGGGATSFLAKFTDAGALQWAESTGGATCSGLAVSSAGVYVAGSFSGRVVLGSTMLDAVSGAGDAYVAKLTESGATHQFVWAVRGGGNYTDGLEDVAVSGNKVYAVGTFSSPTVSFGSLTLSNTGGFSDTGDMYVLKLQDNGNSASFVWAVRGGGTGIDGASNLVLAGTNVYVTGLFESATATFGTSTLQKAPSTAPPGYYIYDVFLAKLVDAGSSGSFAWAQRLGGPGDDRVTGLAGSGSRVYVAGTFRGTASFGSTTLTGDPTYNDMFMTQLTDGGASSSFDWVQQAGGVGDDVAGSIALAGSSLYLGGWTSGAATFGTYTMPGPSCCSAQAFLTALAGGVLGTKAARQPELSVFPNPVRGSVQVQLPVGAPRTGLRYVLVDAAGRTLLSRSWPGTADRATVALGLLPKGLYLLRMEGPGGYFASRRLVAE